MSQNVQFRRIVVRTDLFFSNRMSRNSNDSNDLVYFSCLSSIYHFQSNSFSSLRSPEECTVGHLWYLSWWIRLSYGWCCPNLTYIWLWLYGRALAIESLPAEQEHHRQSDRRTHPFIESWAIHSTLAIHFSPHLRDSTLPVPSCSFFSQSLWLWFLFSIFSRLAFPKIFRPLITHWPSRIQPVISLQRRRLKPASDVVDVVMWFARACVRSRVQACMLACLYLKR